MVTARRGWHPRGQGVRHPAVAEHPSQNRQAPGTVAWVLLLATAAVPLSLLWDFAWEFTVGIEPVWAPPHAANYAAIFLAALAGIFVTVERTRAREPAVALAGVRAPFGVWLALWGAVAYLTAVLADQWWQAGYGQAAGIWHPPQLLKALAFLSVLGGSWLHLANRQERRGGTMAFAIAGGVLLALISVVTLPGNFANRQHGAVFYQVACGTYPLVLAASAVAGRGRFPATRAALAYTVLIGVTVWLLPLIPGRPLAGPVFNPREFLLPPPFPLLIVVPALGFDLLLRVFPSRSGDRGRAVELALVFFFLFVAAQWNFAGFLLSPAADHWFFAGGGKHWPPVQAISAEARTSFWPAPGHEFTAANAALAAGLALVSAQAGLWLGAWMKRLRA
jgi:hypothetical protein